MIFGLDFTLDNSKLVLVPVPWAKENNLVDGDCVDVSTNGTSVKLPIVLQPGMANGTFAVSRSL